MLPRIITGLAALFVFASCAPLPVNQGPEADPSGPVKVGLLVPLGSGDPQTESLARSLANAAMLARSDVTGAEIDLHVYPTSGTSAGAAAAAAQAIAEGAIILAGPLFGTETAAVAPLARQAGVPVLALSDTPSIGGDGVYVLRAGTDSLATRLLLFAGSRGLRSVAVVYPQGAAGQAARDVAADATERAGSVLVAAEGFSSATGSIPTDTAAIATRLRASGANAIIFTEAPSPGPIAQGLRSAGLGASAWQFIGLTRWDASSALLAEPALGGGWFAVPDPSLTAQFNARYAAAYGQTPDVLAGVAYDSIAAIGAMLSAARAGGSKTPFSLAAITDPSGFAGVNGIFRFNADGSSQHGLAVMQVIGGKAQVIDPAPRSFPGPQG